MVIANRFPKPPNRVLAALQRLKVLDSRDLRAASALDREPGWVPRPWDPASCDDELRFDVWTWCDDVVTWINREYAWRGVTSVPPCWPRHPYLAHEIALLACLRYAAGQADAPQLLEDWTRVIFPAFIDRMLARTGEGCHTEHTDWPGAAAFHRHVESAVAKARLDLFRADTNQPVPTDEWRSP